jgi:hypothetical protein
VLIGILSYFFIFSFQKQKEDLTELFPTNILPAGLSYLGYTNTTELMFSGAESGVVVTYKTDDGAIILHIGRYSSSSQAENYLSNFISSISPYADETESFNINGTKIGFYAVAVGNESLNIFLWKRDNILYGMKGKEKKLMEKLLNVIL